VTIAILAGGRATRFGGRDKSAIRVGGRTILERLLAELSPLGEVLLVGGGHAAPGVRAVPDSIPGCGPLGGLHAALGASHDDPTVVVACDMPFVTGALAAYLARLTDRVDAVVPQTDGGLHPLCAAYTRACLDPVSRRLARGHLTMTELLGDVRLRLVTVEELDQFGDHRHLLANLNTPLDLGRVEALETCNL
jgi:molybdopterin-guanine dinucleotide biosynthesis protein A